MNAKHSPTPWCEMNSHKKGFKDIVSLGNDDPEQRMYICQLEPRANTFADCTFIVQCVNSHASLVAALEISLAYLESDSDDDQEREDFETIRAAISKAKGEL